MSITQSTAGAGGGELDRVAEAYEARVAAVPERVRQFADDTWGKTWAHAEMGSLLDFAALASAPPAGQGNGERVRHVKSGGEYEVLDRAARLQTNQPLTDYAEVVVYRGTSGATWVRPAAEMNDGRFVPIASAPPAPTPDAGGDLDARLKAAGMFTIAEMMGETPLSRWTTHVGVTDLASFGEWLDRRTHEFLRMRVAYELGDKSKDDDLYEWTLAHSAAFSTAREHFTKATASTPPRKALAGQGESTAAEKAYGILWRIYGSGHGYAKDARALLREALNEPARRRGIAWANEKYGQLGPDPALMLNQEERAELGRPVPEIRPED